MKADFAHSVLGRIVLLGIVSVLAGCYWNLSWFMALPLIALVCPIVISVLIARLFPNLSFGRKTGFYAGTVVVAEIVRNFLYVFFGQGLDYLLHDGETQLVGLALIAEQLIFGTIVTGGLTLIRRRRIESVETSPCSEPDHKNADA